MRTVYHSLGTRTRFAWLPVRVRPAGSGGYGYPTGWAWLTWVEERWFACRGWYAERVRPDL